MLTIQSDENLYLVYDIETLLNFSSFCFEDFQTGKKKQFVIHDSCNDFKSLISFLLSIRKLGYYMVGFNNIFFDAQILQYILNNRVELSLLPPAVIARAIHQESQRLIGLPEQSRFEGTVSESKLYMKQIDLYKQKHYDGKAKRTSLKWLEFTMNMNSIEEMPISPNSAVDAETIDKILGYNWHDVYATKEFFKRNKFETELRLKLSEQFGLPLLNASEPRMAREILAKLLANDLGISVTELKAKRTFRNEIHLGKCIIPIVKFKEEIFKELVKKLKRTTVNGSNLKGSFEHSINYKGIDIDYGVGGVHGAVKSGVYSSDEDYIIKTVDVISFYPRIIINYGFAPAHLGETFARRYDWFFTERKKYGKKDPINYIYKIILNSTYGLSNDVNSFLYDPLTTMKTTINGQLLLSMLAESLADITNSQLIMLNTDGLEIRIPRNMESQFYECCKAWEELTGLQLEYDEYDKIILGDVNNYIGVFAKKELDKETWIKLKDSGSYDVFFEEDNKFYFKPVKLKGRFETKLDYHKNPSSIVVPKALYEYFVKGNDVKEFIESNNNIHDFCFGVKKKYDFELLLYTLSKGIVMADKQQKVCRYYVSKDGGRLIKNYLDGRTTRVYPCATALVTPANRIDDTNCPDNLDKRFYISEANKEIENIMATTNQLTLF